jgi:hypothetical protein
MVDQIYRTLEAYVGHMFTFSSADQFLVSRTFKSSKPSDELKPIQFSRFKTEFDLHFEYRTLHNHHDQRAPLKS